MSTFDQEIMARTALGEARGDGIDSMIAVMWTIMNRFTAKRWYSGLTLAATAMLKEQYDCWMNSDPNYAYITAVTDGIPLVTQALVAAADIIAGRILDPTQGATHYYADSMPYPPDWVPTGEFTVKSGRQNFYKNVP